MTWYGSGLSFEDRNTRGGRVSMRDVLVDAEKRLAAAGVPSPSADAATLVAHVLGVPRTRLLLQDPMTSTQRVRLEQLLVKRIARVPLQHLVGTAAFRHLELKVGRGVFVPRPETELVAETALTVLADLPAGDRLAVDLCTGSGAIALSLGTELDGVEVHAVELDGAAVDWAADNIEAHRDRLAARGSRVVLHRADATTVADPGAALSVLAGRVPLVVSNPPYIPERAVPRDPEVRDHDPVLALYGGPDGLDVVRGLAVTAALLLRPGGVFVVEHADEQGEQAGDAGVPGLLRAQVVDEVLADHQHTPEGRPVWTEVADRIDLARRPRFTVAVRA